MTGFWFGRRREASSRRMCRCTDVGDGREGLERRRASRLGETRAEGHEGLAAGRAGSEHGEVARGGGDSVRWLRSRMEDALGATAAMTWRGDQWGIGSRVRRLRVSRAD